MPHACRPPRTGSSRWRPPAPEWSGGGEAAGFEALLVHTTAVATGAGHDVRPLVVDLADRLDELGAAVDQADAVVGAVRLGQRAVGDQPVHGGAAGLLGVVVHAAA